MERLLNELFNKETSRRDFLKKLALAGATLVGVSFAECEQPKETGATQVKKPESKPSYSSSMDERIIERIRERGKEINDVFLEMKNTFSEEGGKKEEFFSTAWIGTHFNRAAPLFDLFYRTKGDINERINGYLFLLGGIVLPRFSVHWAYDNLISKGSYPYEDILPKKSVEGIVESWDEELLKQMKSAIEGKKPSEIFLIVDPRVAKKKWKYEIEKYCGKRYPKTTEIWMGEEYRGILDEYGAGWRNEIKKREDEIKEEIEKTCKYLGKKYSNIHAEDMAYHWLEKGLWIAEHSTLP